ncbi:hypothetical protein [Herbaspirillum sp. YR522]|uniref:hypothetical protein n=1 Tax=Herbaspirillum sp. YR522 TaxID=1144342 RepID=UPI0009DB3482|nr:hypothetical protein [Herbaspirillum sp. YR522]
MTHDYSEHKKQQQSRARGCLWRERFTTQEIKSSDAILLADGVIKNPSVVRELTSDGANIADWGKYTTQSVTMPNGQSMQLHYYMNSVTVRSITLRRTSK